MVEYRIETREDGLRWLLIVDGWSSELSGLVNSGEIDGVELNSSRGSWPGGLPFLQEVPQLRHLILIDLQEERIDPIQKLTRLDTLTLNAYAMSGLDFAALSRLRKAAIEWRPSYRNLSACTDLVELSLNRYSVTDLTTLSALASLRRLRIGDSRMLSTLSGVEGLRELRSLALVALPRLKDLSPTSSLAGCLEELNIKQCRSLHSLQPVAELRRLRRIIIEDCGRIDSLKPLAGLDELEEVYFFGDTVIADGDLDFLRNSAIRRVSFKNRRHYSVRREELPGFAP